MSVCHQAVDCSASGLLILASGAKRRLARFFRLSNDETPVTGYSGYCGYLGP